MKSTTMKATRESAAVRTSAQAGSSARGIRSHDTAVIESAKGTRMDARRRRSEGVADTRVAEVEMTSRGATEVAVMKETRAA
jgi:hypothetical protein